MNSMASEKIVTCSGTCLDRLDQVLVVVAGLPQALAVEEGLGQGVQLVGVARRQVKAEAQLFAVYCR